MCPASSSRIGTWRSASKDCRRHVAKAFEVRLTPRIGSGEFEFAEQRRIKEIQIDRWAKRVLLDHALARGLRASACPRSISRSLVSRYSCGDDAKKKARSKVTRACGAFTITSRSISSGDSNCADGEFPLAPKAHIDSRSRRRVLRLAADSGFRRTAPACCARSHRS